MSARLWVTSIGAGRIRLPPPASSTTTGTPGPSPTLARSRRAAARRSVRPPGSRLDQLGRGRWPIGRRLAVLGLGGITATAQSAAIKRNAAVQAAAAQQAAAAAKQPQQADDTTGDGSSRSILEPGRTNRLDVAMEWEGRIYRQKEDGKIARPVTCRIRAPTCRRAQIPRARRRRRAATTSRRCRRAAKGGGGPDVGRAVPCYASRNTSRGGTSGATTSGPRCSRDSCWRTRPPRPRCAGSATTPSTCTSPPRTSSRWPRATASR